jgi:hypothetical protein
MRRVPRRSSDWWTAPLVKKEIVILYYNSFTSPNRLKMNEQPTLSGPGGMLV